MTKACEQLLDRTSSSDFIEAICAEVRKGVGFVPLIGSGMSAPSGILMGQEFRDFLAYATYRVLATNDDGKSRWSLRSHGWPKRPDASEVKAAKRWIRKKFEDACLSRGFAPRFDDADNLLSFGRRSTAGGSPGDLALALTRPLVPVILRGSYSIEEESATKELLRLFAETTNEDRFVARPGYSKTSEEFIIEKGIRSLHDWRATLEFLAAVDLRADRLTVRELDSTVIDSFNTHITRDKQSNLGHKMLAHLSRPMRIRTVLTTNFDSLIEEAYRKIHFPLTVLPVSVKGELPHQRTVRAQNSIVKLHGELLDTRADFSLDMEPTIADRERFAGYVRYEGDVCYAGDQPEKQAIPNHLLVMGYSGSDLRCIQMIKHLMDAHRKVRVFWVCYNDDDLRRVSRETFPEKSYREQLITFRTARPDLLLYELYQQLALSLPGGGFSYQFTHNVPPERGPASQHLETRTVTKLRAIIREGTPPMDMARQMTTEYKDSDRAAKEHVREAVSQEVGELIAKAIQKPELRFPKNLERYAHAERFRPPPRDSAEQQRDSEERTNCLVVDLATGAANALRVAFRILSDQHFQPVWLELQDFADVPSLIQEMLRIVALRVGAFQLEHAVLYPLRSPDGEEKPRSPHLHKAEDRKELVTHLKRLAKYLGIVPEEWVYFLYARNGPAACAGWNNKPWSGKEIYASLGWLIDVFGEVGFRIVYAPLTEKRCERDRGKSEQVQGMHLGSIEKLLARLSGDQSGATGDVDTERAFRSFLKANDGAVDSPYPLRREHADSVTTFAAHAPDFPGHGDLALYDEIISDTVKRWLLEEPDATWLEGEDDESRRGYFLRRRLQFLYATTLFRQSRHVSAFFSDASYSCPFRFGATGTDNDWLRSNHVRKWVNELRTLRVFYHKPGGYCWKHRDVRLGLQELLQRIPFFEYFDVGGKAGKQAFLGEIRARSHFWIGDWYFKAFCATGHSLPLIESLYHRYMCARFAPYARPRQLSYSNDDRTPLVDYRLVLCQSAVMEMVKTVKVAKPWLKFWLAGVFGHPMAERPAIDELKADLTRSINSVVKIAGKKPPRFVVEAKDRIKRSIELLDQELDSLNHSLKGEVGIAAGKVWLPPLPVWSGTPPKADQKTQNDLKKLKAIDLESQVTFDVDVVGQPESKDDRPWRRPLDPWLTDLRAEFITKQMDEYDVTFSQDKEEAARKRLNSGLNEEKAKWIVHNSSRHVRLHRLIEIIGELAYVYLKRAKLEFHATGKRPLQRWVQVTALCYLGIDYCKHLPPQFWRDELRQKIKLHTLYSLALANLDRYFEAHRHLNEATSLLSKCQGSLDEVEMAIIRLRRAEVYITETLRLNEIIEALDEGLPKGQQEGQVERIESSLKWREFWVKFRNDELGGRLRHAIATQAGDRWEERGELSYDIKCFQTRLLRLQAAALDDAWVTLESAEKLLSGRSHSSLWWGRLIALKLRVYGAHNLKLSSDQKRVRCDTLVFRRRGQGDANVEEFLEKGLLVSPGDHYRRLRFEDYFIDAYRSVKSEEPLFRKDLQDTLRKLWRDAEESSKGWGSDHLLSKYLARLGDKLAECGVTLE